MANIYYVGEAVAVAQVSTGSIDSVDGTPANNTFTVTINGVSVSQVGDTDVATTAAALLAKLTASTHPYFAAVTWTNPSAGSIVGTGTSTQAPFTASLTETGAGTGTVTDFTLTTAPTGPNTWSDGDNWSGGSIPANTDVVYIDRDGVKLLWGISQNAVTLAELHIRRDTIIGLHSGAFATDGTDSARDAAASEYRDHYLQIKATLVKIGEHLGAGPVVGSKRIKIDNTITTASVTEIHNTAGQALETSLPAVRLLFSSANADLDLRQARSGAGIAVDLPGETSTVGDVSISDPSSTSRFFTGDGVTASKITANGGISRINLAATLPEIDQQGGQVTVEGSELVTLWKCVRGKAVPNNVPSGGVGVTTMTQDGGEVDWTVSSVARTVTNYNFNQGTRRRGDHLTITNDNRTGRTVETVAR